MDASAEDAASLADLLEHEPGRFEPMTAFRVAQQASDSLEADPNIGVSLAPVPVGGLRRRAGGVRIRATLVGLLGPLGGLPPSYNDLALREARNKSGGLASFLDLFSARLDALFVEASEKYRLPRLLRWRACERRNGFVKALFGLTGFATAGLRERSGVGDDLILRFSGFFAARTRNAVNLKAMLGQLTSLPVDITLFEGRWLAVPPAEQSQLGRERAVRLGHDAMAGAAIRDFSSAFRIVVGPLDYRDYLAMAPGGRLSEDIIALTRLYVGTGLAFDIRVILKKEQIPFSRPGDSADPPRLGWNAWARIAPAPADCADGLVAAPNRAPEQAA